MGLARICFFPSPQDDRPSAEAVCVHGDYRQALEHLNNKLISIHNPEEVRGGGLLKYARLLVGGYKVSIVWLLAALNCRRCLTRLARSALKLPPLFHWV